LAAISDSVTIARELYKAAVKVGVKQDVLDAIKQYGSTLVSLDQTIKSNFETYREISTTKKQLLPQGWLAAELELTSDAKLQFRGATGSFKDEIAQKKTDGSLSANDLRTCLERILKDVCAALEVKLAFRYNDENERRMSGELIIELRSTLKKKSPGTLAEPVFSCLETCNLITTTGSHDSGPILSSGDIAVAYEYVLNLDKLFFCSKCRRYVSVDQYVSHERKIFCGCGSVHVEWRD